MPSDFKLSEHYKLTIYTVINMEVFKYELLSAEIGITHCHVCLFNSIFTINIYKRHLKVTNYLQFKAIFKPINSSANIDHPD